jgi:hypothetical protein
MSEPDAADAYPLKVAYERVREFIARRTVGHAEQRAVRETELRCSLCAHADIPLAAVRTALRALAEQGVILHADGWVTMDTTERPWLRQVIAWCAARENPPQAFIGACNRRLQQLEGEV